MLSEGSPHNLHDTRMGRTGVGRGRSLPAERHSSAKSFADAGCPKHCTKQRVRKLLADRRDRIPVVCAAHAGLNLAWRGIRMRSVAPIAAVCGMAEAWIEGAPLFAILLDVPETARPPSRRLPPPA
jgi:hypothetical protein